MFRSTLVICFCLLSLSQAAVYSERYFKDPAHPGKCVIKEKVVSPGQSIKHPVMACAQFTCDNAQGLATIETCDPVSALPSPFSMIKYDPRDKPTCSWGDFINTNAPYPECCKRHISCVL
ncbi:PREDICTED: uncharacterized protein LOC108969627 [Bactrocera latifrons]|uniref:uncharacterized protein LOC108969627 n=1 Tax=Bactrocera latifrons TaxID=174628 RepID=UPI0008DDA4F4|nr:PREDICTED: uncharacterized protein LOC108969627 [Bactrocera latifrons]